MTGGGPVAQPPAYLTGLDQVDREATGAAIEADGVEEGEWVTSRLLKQGSDPSKI